VLRGSSPAFIQGHEHLFFSIDESGGVVAGELEAMPVRNRVRGTGFYTVAAKDAAVVVNVIDLGVPLSAAKPRLRCILRSFDVNAIGRARRRAQKAGYAFFEAVLVALENVRAAIAFFKPRRTVRIVLGDGRLQHFLEGDAHPFGDRGRGPNYTR